MDARGERALNARFIGWLQARSPEDAALATRAHALLPLLSGTAGAGLLTEAEALALPRLRQLWLEFERGLPADWVEWSGAASDVLWVEHDGDIDRGRPPGDVPRLVSVEADEPTDLRRPTPLPGLLLLAAAALLVLLPLSRSWMAARRMELEMADLEAATARGDIGWKAMHARLVRQEYIAGQLVAARQAQRQAVNLACEGGPTCSARVAALDRSLRLAESVRAAAASDQAQPALAAATATLPQPSLPRAPPSILRDERQALHARLAATDLPPAERRVVEAEIAALDVFLSPPHPAP